MKEDRTGNRLRRPLWGAYRTFVPAFIVLAAASALLIWQYAGNPAGAFSLQQSSPTENASTALERSDSIAGAADTAARRLLADPSAGKEALAAALTNRSRAIGDLASLDPAAAAKLLLSKADAEAAMKRLPDADVERYGDLSATYLQEHGDAVNSGGAFDREVEQPLVRTADGSEYVPVPTAGSFDSLNLKSGDSVSLSAARLGSYLFADPGAVRVVSRSAEVSDEEAPAAIHTLSNAGNARKLLAILVKWTDSPPPADPRTYDPAAIRTKLLTGPWSVVWYLNATTDGSVSLSGDVTPSWLTLPYAMGSGCDYLRYVRDAEAAAKGAGYNLGAYTNVMVIWQPTRPCGFAGIAEQDGKWTAINKVYEPYMAHELGHNLGLPHAHGANGCRVRPADRLHAQQYVACASVEEYGNLHDAMGNPLLWSDEPQKNQAALDVLYAAGFNASYKDRLDASPGEVGIDTKTDFWKKPAGTSKSYKFTLSPVNAPVTGKPGVVRSVAVPDAWIEFLSSSGISGTYRIEYRQSALYPNDSGVMVNVETASDHSQTYLLSGNDPLTQGKQFTSATGALTMHVDAVRGATADVTVTLKKTY